MKIKNASIFALLFVLMTSTFISCGSTSNTTGTSGGSGQAFKGTVTGNKDQDHKIAFKLGQVLKVTLNADSKSCYFNVLTESNETIFNGSNEGNQFSGTMGSTGFYRLRVYLMGAAKSENQSVNYTLTYSLK
jgi:hypothetical protein